MPSETAPKQLNLPFFDGADKENEGRELLRELLLLLVIISPEHVEEDERAAS